MRVLAVIDQPEVVEKILRHLGLWSGGQTLAPARSPPNAADRPWTRSPREMEQAISPGEPCDDVDPMPD